jgi:fluoride exporter
MMQMVVVAAGGALGSVLRFGVQKMFNLDFPYGTFAVNIIGCFLAGCFFALFNKGINSSLFLFLMTGFCGGFTTFSAFSTESVQMILADRWIHFSLYIIASLTIGLLATFLGFKIFSE